MILVSVDSVWSLGSDTRYLSDVVDSLHMACLSVDIYTNTFRVSNGDSVNFLLLQLLFDDDRICVRLCSHMQVV